jgi:hypothetical protein
MQILILMIFCMSTEIYAQNISEDEAKKLIEENQMLKSELVKAQENPQNSQKLMEALKKGQKYQEDQAKALEELDRED